MSDKIPIDHPEIKWVDYVPLHCHSYYSLLDGFCSPEDMAEAAVKNKFRAIALTDHGSCAGLYNFYKACRERKIKPILGMESYLVDDLNIKNKDDKRLHVTLLAKNKVGYRNLIAISSTAHLKGFYSRPRVDIELLKKHKEGIICGSACIGGIAAHYIKENDIEHAKKNLLLFQEIYGDDFFVEIMAHKYNDEKTTKEFKVIMKKLYDMAKELHILPVATCDSHYANKEDHKAQDLLLSIGTGDTIKNPQRFSFDSDDFYIKSYDELSKIFIKIPELVTNSLIIADKIEDNVIEIGKDLLPDFKLPPGESSEGNYLKSLIDDGMVNRGLKGKPEYEARIAEEWDVITSLKYEKYFLILWDVIAYAKREKIRVGVGRGCFLPKSKIVTNKNKKNIEDIKVGDKVLAHDGKFHDVLSCHEYNVNEDVIDISLCDGRVISCTSDHKIHINRKGKHAWVMASELKEGEDVIDIKVGNGKGY